MQEPAAESVAWAWRNRAVRRFAAGYAETTGALITRPEDESPLSIFLIEEAFARLARVAEHGPEARGLAAALVLHTLDSLATL